MSRSRRAKIWIGVGVLLLAIGGVALLESDNLSGQGDSDPARVDGTNIGDNDSEPTGPGGEPGSTGGSSERSPSADASVDPSKQLATSDWAFGSYRRGPDANDPQPSTCPRFERGKPCTLLFTGKYQLISRDAAVVRLSAYEDTSEGPVTSVDVPVKRGGNRFYGTLEYTPSAGAKWVRFRVTLIDPGGSTLFEQNPPEPPIPLGEN